MSSPFFSEDVHLDILTFLLEQRVRA